MTNETTNEETACCPCKCQQKKAAWNRLVGLALAAFERWSKRITAAICLAVGFYLAIFAMF